MGRRPKLENLVEHTNSSKVHSSHVKLVLDITCLDQLKTIKGFVELNPFWCYTVHDFLQTP